MTDYEYARSRMKHYGANDAELDKLLSLAFETPSHNKWLIDERLNVIRTDPRCKNIGKIKSRITEYIDKATNRIKGRYVRTLSPANYK